MRTNSSPLHLAKEAGLSYFKVAGCRVSPIKLSFEANFHRHAHECAGRPHETAGHGHYLPDIAPNGHGDEIESADTAVRRIKGDLARAWYINFRPGMRRPRTSGPRKVLTRIVEMTGRMFRVDKNTE